MSLPIQDVEVFIRAYTYILGLQSSICCMNQLSGNVVDNADAQKNILHKLQLHCIMGTSDSEWILKAMVSFLETFQLVQNNLRTLRIPLILTKKDFLVELRKGSALYSLHRLAFLSRLNTIVLNALDVVLEDLDFEELGKRGCSTSDLSSFNVDLKARHVTVEGLSWLLGMKFTTCKKQKEALPAWWD